MAELNQFKAELCLDLTQHLIAGSVTTGIPAGGERDHCPFLVLVLVVVLQINPHRGGGRGGARNSKFISGYDNSSNTAAGSSAGLVMLAGVSFNPSPIRLTMTSA